MKQLASVLSRAGFMSAEIESGTSYSTITLAKWVSEGIKMLVLELRNMSSLAASSCMDNANTESELSIIIEILK